MDQRGRKPRIGRRVTWTALEPPRNYRCAIADTRCTASPRWSGTASGSRACPIRCASCWKTCCEPRTAPRSPGTISRRSRAGSRARPNAPRSRFSPPAFCCRISPAFRRSSISRRCATPWSGSAAIPPKSIRYSRSNSSSTIRSRPTPSGFRARWRINQQLDYRRNGERYALLKWGQQAFKNFRVAPPNSGICHQVNIEYLARVVFGAEEGPKRRARTRSPIRTRWWERTRTRRW